MYGHVCVLPTQLMLMNTEAKSSNPDNVKEKKCQGMNVTIRLQAVFGILVLAGVAYLMRPLLGAVTRRTLATMAGEYVSGTHSMAFVTAPSEEVAKKLAHGLVSNKLVACVNVIPKITSIYEWEGKIEEDSEYLLMMKTRTVRLPDVTKFVVENHPYDVAEVISSPIDQGNPAYLKWLGDIVGEKSQP